MARDTGIEIHEVPGVGRRRDQEVSGFSVDWLQNRVPSRGSLRPTSMTTLPPPPRSCKVYTTANLARAMVAAIGDEVDARWLDPCVGNGAFFQALTDLGVGSARIRAIDLEPEATTKNAF